MCNMEFSWIPTDEYLRMLRSGSRLEAVGVERFANSTYYRIAFRENLKSYQEENGLPCSEKIHCFRMKMGFGTEKYYKRLAALDNDEVYFFFEGDSRYTHANSPELFIEERLRQGIAKKDVEEGNVRYREYLELLNESVTF